MDTNEESLETQSNQQQLHHINQTFFNYRKNISSDQHSQLHIDSAYGSGYITPNCTPNISTSINLSEALTPERNHLNIINENLIDSINLTPVTQNINRICNFHITTPKSQDFFNTTNNNNINKKDIQKIYNIKRSSEYLYNFDNYQSTPKKFKIHNNSVGSEIITKNSTPLKENDNKNIKFRQKLHSAPDLDGYFDENLFSPKKSNKISTKNNHRKPFNTLLNNNNKNNERESASTPVTTIIENTDSVEKLLNFSNEQFSNLINATDKNENNLKVIDESLEFNDFYADTDFCDLKNNNFTNINTNEPIKIETNAAKAPFRRFLSFGNDSEFKSPKCTISNSNSSTNSAEKNQTANDDFYLENSFRQYKKQYRILNTVCNDRLVAKQRANAARLADLEKIFSEKSDTNNSQSTDLSKIDENETPVMRENLECSNLSFSLLPNLKNLYDKEKSIIKNDDYIPLTPPKRKLSFEDEFLTTIDEEEKNHKDSIRNTLPTTPKKQKISNNIQNNSNYEKFEIIYPTIPTTPRKNISPKRKQDCKNIKKQQTQYRKFYGGAQYLNIIVKLELYPVVLDRIFDYLSSTDLLNLSMVTKTHRKIIKDNSKAKRRLNKYLNDFQICKENYGIKKIDIHTDIKKKLNSEIICRQVKKMPFKQCNIKTDRKRSLDIIHSPPVSPSKKKFYENQKVVNTLSGNQSISKCPRCAKASRIIDTSLEEAIHNNNNNNIFTNQFSISKNSTESFHVPSPAYYVPQRFDNEISSSSSTLTQSQPIQTAINRPKSKLTKSASVDTGLLQIKAKRQQKIPFQPYGECMSKNCNFKFCLDCTCEYHPATKCKLTASVSPSKEDIQNGILQLINSPYSKKSIVASRSSKMLRRKSLKRLCF